MKILLFKNLYFYPLLAGFAFMLAACDLFPEDTVTVTGTVIITRRGEPWNPEHSHFVESRNVQNDINIDETRAAARDDWRPPPNYPRIYINKNLAMNDDDLAQGKYTWKIEIPSRYLPGPLYLEFAVPMANFLPAKTIDIWVEDENSEIDLGVIDFDVIRLRGSLPVTFNGERLSYYGNYSTNNRCILYIRTTDGSGIGGSPDIGFNENWMQDVYARDSEIPLTFTLETCHRGGFFKKDLNPDHIITIHNTDKEIIFPDYPYVDFEAVALKGTINLLVPNGHYLSNSWLNCTIGFYDTEKKEETCISYLYIGTLWENENVSLNWETMVPPFSFPKTLLFELAYRNYFARTVNSSIIITEETDLNDIFLGSFPADLR